MVNPDSTLYAEHPDWVVGQPARRPRRWRNQLVLDVLQPDVADFVIGVVDRVLAENPGISYLKWDANRPLTDPGSPTLGADRQANYWVDQARATWRLMETVAERHPEQTLMLCASGGGRVDLGSLRWFHEVWLSDNTDPLDRVRMQWAASHFLPANVVGAHVTREGDRPLAFGCAVAMSARFGFDLDFAAHDRRRAGRLPPRGGAVPGHPAARPTGRAVAVGPSGRALPPSPTSPRTAGARSSSASSSPRGTDDPARCARWARPRAGLRGHDRRSRRPTPRAGGTGVERRGGRRSWTRAWSGRCASPAPPASGCSSRRSRGAARQRRPSEVPAGVGLARPRQGALPAPCGRTRGGPAQPADGPAHDEAVGQDERMGPHDRITHGRS